MTSHFLEQVGVDGILLWSNCHSGTYGGGQGRKFLMVQTREFCKDGDLSLEHSLPRSDYIM